MTGMPVLTVILVIVAVLVHIVMSYTSFGRAIYAIGGNATAARLAGINLSRVRVIMYMISGGIAVWPGAPHRAHDFGEPGQRHRPGIAGDHGGLPGRRRDVRRQGDDLGTFLAVILVGVLNNGMNLLGFNTFVHAWRSACCSSPRWRCRSGARPRRAGAHEHRGQELSRVKPQRL